MSSAFVRALLCAAALSCAAAPNSAQASGVPFPRIEEAALPSFALLYAAVPMFALDVLLLAIDRPLPQAIAVLQIAVVGLLLPIATLATVDDAGFEQADIDMLKVIAVVSLIWFSGHGIYSIAEDAAREKAKRHERANALWRRDAGLRSLTDS